MASVQATLGSPPIKVNDTQIINPIKIPVTTEISIIEDKIELIPTICILNVGVMYKTPMIIAGIRPAAFPNLRTNKSGIVYNFSFLIVGPKIATNTIVNRSEERRGGK